MGTTQNRRDELWKRKKEAIIEWYSDIAVHETYSSTDEQAASLLRELDRVQREYFIEKNGRVKEE